MERIFPFAVGSEKLAMWLFIASDAVTFAVLLVAYGYARAGSAAWPAPFHVWPSIVIASVMTGVLLSSSFTMAFSVRAARKGHTKGAVQYILLTILGGLAFLALHMNEWRGLIQAGVRLTENPWGAPLFGGTFFTLTGLHMLHVAGGVVYLAAVARGFKAGRYTAVDVEVSGLYWYFVDVVWIVLFPILYLLSIA